MRKLQGTQKYLIDPKTIPKNHVVINPSIAGDVVYMRVIKSTETGDKSEISLFNAKTSETIQVSEAGSMLASCSRYIGLEDLRIMWFEERLYFVATTTHASKRMQSETVLGLFSEDLKQVERLDYLNLGAPPIKNICPFILNGEFMLLDTFKKTIHSLSMKENDTGNGKDVIITPYKHMTLHPSVVPKSVDFEMRGSTAPIHLHGDTWGCIVHDIIYTDNRTFHTKTKLAYLHYYIEFDVSSGLITFISSPFFLVHFGIEFVSGISYDVNTGAVTLFLGVDDKVPCAVETTLYNLRA